MSYHEQCIKCKGDCCDGVGAGEMCRNCLKEEIKELTRKGENLCCETGTLLMELSNLKAENKELALNLEKPPAERIHCQGCELPSENERLKEVNKMVRKDWRDTHIMYLEGEQEIEKLKETCNILSDDEQREALCKSLKGTGKTYPCEEVRKRLGISEEEVK